MQKNVELTDRVNNAFNGLCHEVHDAYTEMPRFSLALPMIIGAGRAVASWSGEVPVLYDYLIWGAVPAFNGIVNAARYAREETGIIKGIAAIEGFVKGALMTAAAEGAGYGAAKLVPEFFPELR